MNAGQKARPPANFTRLSKKGSSEFREDLADPPHALLNRFARRRVRDSDVTFARLAERAARRHGDGGLFQDPLAQGRAVEAYIDLREDIERAARPIRRES